MSAPLDPQRIFRELPSRERANFLAAYREALDGARDPAGWGTCGAFCGSGGDGDRHKSPGFYEAQEAALTGTGGGTLLEDYIQMRRAKGHGEGRPESDTLKVSSRASHPKPGPRETPPLTVNDASAPPTLTMNDG